MEEVLKRIRFNGFDYKLQGQELKIIGRNQETLILLSEVKHRVVYEQSTRVLFLGDNWSVLIARGEVRINLG